MQPSAALAALRTAKGLAVKDQLAAAAAQQARDQKFSLEIDWIKAVPGGWRVEGAAAQGLCGLWIASPGRLVLPRACRRGCARKRASTMPSWAAGVTGVTCLLRGRAGITEQSTVVHHLPAHAPVQLVATRLPSPLRLKSHCRLSFPPPSRPSAAGTEPDFVLVSCAGRSRPGMDPADLKKVVDAKRRGEENLRLSGLGYTIIRPGGLRGRLFGCGGKGRRGLIRCFLLRTRWVAWTSGTP